MIDLRLFWPKVNKDADNGCWEWTAYCDDDGYGRFRVRRTMQRAHRISYLMHIGEIPDGMLVCHTCDNRKCVNPLHFFLGDDQANATDCFQKGRTTAGEKHGRAKLTESDILEICALRSAGTKLKDIADQFGISKGHACDISKRNAWKHLMPLSSKEEQSVDN